MSISTSTIDMIENYLYTAHTLIQVNPKVNQCNPIGDLIVN